MKLTSTAASLGRRGEAAGSRLADVGASRLVTRGSQRGAGGAAPGPHRARGRGRAAGEQHVGEAAGRGADVEGGAAGRVQPERLQGGGELEAAAGDIGVLGGRLDPCARGDGVRGARERPSVDPHQPGADRGLGAGPALEMAVLHEEQVGARRDGGARPWRDDPIRAGLGSSGLRAVPAELRRRFGGVALSKAGALPN